jgi:hypothetical protein
MAGYRDSQSKWKRYSYVYQNKIAMNIFSKENVMVGLLSVLVISTLLPVAGAPGTANLVLEMDNVYYQVVEKLSDEALNLIVSGKDQMSPGRLRIYSNGMIYAGEVQRGSGVFGDSLIVNGEKIASVRFERNGTVMMVRLKNGDLVLGKIDKNSVLVFFRATGFPIKVIEKMANFRI